MHSWAILFPNVEDTNADCKLNFLVKPEIGLHVPLIDMVVVW